MTTFINPSNSDYWASNPNRKTLPEGAVIGTDPGNVIYNPDGSRTTVENVADIFKPLSTEEYAQKQADIKSNTAKQIQTSIDAINATYAPIYAKARQEAEGRLGSTATITALSGQRGAPSGAAEIEKTVDYNTGKEREIDARKSAEIMAITNRYQDMERQDLQYQDSLRRSDSEKYLSYMQADEDRKTERATNKFRPPDFWRFCYDTSS